MLRFSNFTGASLAHANLTGADLRASTLVRLRAGGALFTRANLQRADLSHADVAGADFTLADLSLANLHAVRDSVGTWAGASAGAARRTDLDRQEAEAWLRRGPLSQRSAPRQENAHVQRRSTAEAKRPAHRAEAHPRPSAGRPRSRG